MQPELAKRSAQAVGLLERATCVHDAAAVERAIDRIAVRMALDLDDACPVIVCVMNGGLPFTAALLKRLSFPLELDFVHAWRYLGAAPEEDGALHCRVALERDVAGRTVLLVDDVLDEGVTLERLQAQIEADGAGRVLTAVLVDKALPGRTAKADYACLAAPNRFLVGCGMDYNGWWRNLSGIFALDLGDDGTS